jgi:glycosyltransferase involved in cell wall biosynthesis
MPRTSVVIPTHNRPELLGTAITSVLKQTDQNFEIVVVDDGSPDDRTERVVRASGDPRLIYIRLPAQRGVAAARNAGIAGARGSYIAFLDDDDEWSPDKLRMQTAALERCGPEVAGVYTARWTVDSATGLVSVTRFAGSSFEPASGRNLITTSSLIVRRACLDLAGPFDEQLEFSEDYDMWIRIGLAFKFEYLDVVLVKYYQRDRRGEATKVARSQERLLAKHRQLFATDRRGLSRRHLSLGRWYRRAGDPCKSLRELLTAVRLSPFDPRTYLGLVRAWGQGGYRGPDRAGPPPGSPRGQDVPPARRVRMGDEGAGAVEGDGSGAMDG